MDKLELDDRVARLERAFSTFKFTAVALIVGIVLLVFLTATVRETVRAEPAQPVATPAIPAPGSVAALHRDLSILQDLVNQNTISPSERDAKKAQLLAGHLNPENLKTDLDMIQELGASKAITETERNDLRAKLLGIGEPVQKK